MAWVGGEHLGFNTDDLFDVLACERLDVSTVGQLGIGHDGGRIRIDQHHLIALLPESLASLCAGVVELGRLADDDGAGADHQDFLNVISAWHFLLLFPVSQEYWGRDSVLKGHGFSRAIELRLALKGHGFSRAVKIFTKMSGL